MPIGSPPTAARRPWYRTPAFAAAVMCAAVVAVYFPIPEHPDDNTLRGGDFHVVHARRMAFARQSLSAHGTVPAWFPRETMGTPFRANLQSFPLIPTRLVLLALPPQHVYATGVIVSAVLAAAFTFAFARAVGLGPPAAAASGWTFACSGFYASRVISGQLPLLEAYPALPLLLWLVEANFRAAEARATEPSVRRWRVPLTLAALALASTCVALAGHPQLGVYAFVTAGLYAVWRGWRAWRAAAATLLAMMLGVACAGFALWPLALLVGRSTRALPLARGGDDIPYPYGRLGAWVLPWKDGWHADVLPLGGKPFTGYASDMYFLDTVTYVGLLPLAVAAALLVRLVVRRRPGRTAVFLAAAGAVALLTALPLFHRSEGTFAFTLLRSPARQTYVTVFALAIGLGMGLDLLSRWAAAARGATAPTAWARVAAAAVPVLLAAHAIDLTLHDRRFIRTTFIPTNPSRVLEAQLKRVVGDRRAAIDAQLSAPVNRQIDDVGGFDSILLARTYTWFFDLAGAPADFNVQLFNGSALPAGRLREAGVAVVMTTNRRTDLPLLTEAAGAGVYTVPSPLPRAMFLPASSVVYAAPQDMSRMRRQRTFNPYAQLMLQPEASPAAAAAAAAAGAGAVGAGTPPPSSRPADDTLPSELTAVEYDRPAHDEISVRLRKGEGGFLRVMESFDPGWRAELNGRAVEVLPADGAFLAVAVPPGESRVRFTYHTPGATAGAVISGVGLALLAALLIAAWRTPRAAPAAPPS